MKSPWIKTLQQAASNRNLIHVFDDFSRMVACTLSQQTREDQYLRVVGKYTRPQVELLCQAFGELTCEMQAKPFTDLLGPVYMEMASHKGKQMGGEFYTPQHVNQLMAQLVTLPPLPGEIETFCDPAAGSGGMALAHIEHREGHSALCTRVVLWDINALAVDMAYINMTLWGIPATVVHGDTLSQEVFATYQNLFWNMARPHPAGPFPERTQAACDPVAGVRPPTVPVAGPAGKPPRASQPKLFK